MYQKVRLFLMMTVAVVVSSCGFHPPSTANLNQHQTIVELGEKNFKVVAYVKGEAKATYILGFGGLRKKYMIERAKTEMLKNADLVGTSRAIINETVEYHIRNFVFVQQVKICVSAHVVEFTN